MQSFFIFNLNQIVPYSLSEHMFDPSTSGAYVPENSLFTATINSGAFLCESNESQTDRTGDDVIRLWHATPSFSSAVLHLPSCSRFGETCLPVHAEQNRTGLRRGGSPWSVRSWQLQCESHTCAQMWWRSRSVWLDDCYHLIGPIKWNCLNVQLRSNSK